MLRAMFGQEKRIDEGLLLDTMKAIQAYRAFILKQQEQSRMRRPYSLNKLELQIHGFERALDELEQSKYACERSAAAIHKRHLEEMDDEEWEQYRRHVYFYKNGFIRVFSILDKLGFILNQVLELKTERVKSRYSYFTVLRQMHERKTLPELEMKLFELKTKNQDALGRLRSQRNMEIHSLNAEMADDVKNAESGDDDGLTPVENLKANMNDLAASYEMVCRTLLLAFTHLKSKKIC
ncbi:Cthe_2314 family HEPN domain-containing protein [Paenibacillus sp. MBLB4367]|uniref:Cthe_2314 family HEPN domain-containing protein n=1 Tax=Paenibacillus sp. MBLB4367 TaxID=3384767 RepID=UPI0039080D49